MAHRTAACLTAAAATILIGASAAPASAPPGGWSITPSPNPQVPTGQLFWVSCPATNSCMAVGTYVKASGKGVNLAERWNGHSWRVLPMSNPAGTVVSTLLGVACTATSACTAVGSSITTTGASQAVAEQWNGTRWRIQPTPSLAHGGSLNGVSCTSASACTAVGGSGAGPLAERWNGTRWSIQATPNAPRGNGFLSGVSCTSATACIAVGAANPFGPTAKTLAERWNGTKWTIQATPNPSQGGGELLSVSCTSASACTATGNSNAGTLGAQWNGARWSLQSTLTPTGSSRAFLNSVACTSPSACTAVGGYINSSGAFQTLAERWDGSSWSIQATPNPAGTSLLQGVACTSGTACTTVGFSAQTPAAVAEQWDGSTWKVKAAPSPLGAASSNFNSVACTAPSACIAVGQTTSNSRGTSLTLAQRWNGHTWSIQPTPSPADGGALNSVSCTSLSACTAVGPTPNGTTLAERWNGTRWRIQAMPNPTGGGFLLSVSCTSPRACTAVGGTANGTTLAERWNGTSWAIQATPNPSGGALSLLASVSCTSSSACMAVGGPYDNSGNGAGTLAELWNGKNWRIEPTFKPSGADSFLNGVACTSPTACTAVGNSGPATTLAERWNGVRWQVQATPNPPGGQTIVLASVACPTSSACAATGVNQTGSGPRTLAERWSGGRWRIQPTPALTGAYDIAPPAVACPSTTACIAVGGYANNGPELTLAEQWNSATSGSPPATSRLATQGGLAFVRAHPPFNMAASAWRLNHAQPWHRSAARGLLNSTSPTGPGTVAWSGS